MAVGLKLFLEDNEFFEETTAYKSTTGAIQYMLMIRPDLSFVVNKLSQF